jgi:hypothetical protein
MYIHVCIYMDINDYRIFNISDAIVANKKADTDINKSDNPNMPDKDRTAPATPINKGSMRVS